MVIIVGLFVVGFFLRLKGISTNHSFWSDEAYTSEISRDLLLGRIDLASGFKLLWYQVLQLLTVSTSFILFGSSEWSARFPSVIWGSVGIPAAYLLASKLSNKQGGILAAFIYTFLQLNLAYSTQARPYAALQTLMLLELYVVTLMDEKISARTLVAAVFLALISTLYHYLGIFTWIPLIVLTISRYSSTNPRGKKFFIVSGMSFILIIWLLGLYRHIPTFFGIKYNWITYSRELFWRQFSFLTLPAIFGFFLIKSRVIKISIALCLGFVFYSWNFIAYSHNIRYLLPIFGLIIVMFSVFWAKVGEVLLKKPSLVCFGVAILILIGGYKVVRRPAIYYTPNADFFADVQNSDAKAFFNEVYKKFPNFDIYPLFIGPFDTLSWYSQRKPSALFSIYTETPIFDPYNNAWSYGSLDDFLLQQEKYDQGFVIVHDWQSFIPDNVKAYIKKNFILEVRIESMSVSPDEKWPLELYSWGFERKQK